MPDPDTSSSLLEAVKNSSADTVWEAFDSRYRPVVQRFGRRCGLSESDAVELAQEVMIALPRVLPTFQYQRERCRFHTFLEQVAKARLIDFWRRSGRHPTTPLTDAVAEQLPDPRPPELDAHWDAEWRTAIARAAIDWLSAHHRLELPSRSILLELFVPGRPAEEVARRLGRPVQDIYRVRSRWLAKFTAAAKRVRDGEER